MCSSIDGIIEIFCFASPAHEEKGRIIREESARKRYPNYLWRWKENAIKKFGYIEKARDNKPSWTSLQVWQTLCDYWMSKDFEDSSTLRKNNRAKVTFIPHTSGSIPYAVKR